MSNSLKIGEMAMQAKLIMRYLLCYVVIWIVISQITAQAQEKDKNAVIVKSDPPGAMLYFDGENSFVGPTPLKLRPNLKGVYKITATKYGYEKSQMEYFFKGSESGVMRLRLLPKTRFKAGARSLVFPGWGQFYSDRKTSGIMLSIIQAGAGVFTLISHLDYEKAQNNYKDALADFESENFYGQKIEKWEVAKEKYDKANNAFNKRRTWLYITGGIWLYNFFDSIIFFPSYDREIFDKTIPGISANFHEGSVAVTLTVLF